MFGIEDFFMFMVAGILLNITPGPDMFYVATRSAGQGRTAGIASALAIATGGIIHTLAAALGLSALLAHSAIAFDVVRYAGAAYLVWMGGKLLFSRAQAGMKLTARQKEQTFFQIFRQGLVVAVLNPKVALFFLSFLPQFVSPETPDFTAQILILGLTFCATGCVVMMSVALGFGLVSAWAGKRPGLQRMQSRATGGVFVAMGVCLGFTER